MPLKSNSFPFHKKEASTLMFTPFIEAFLTRNGHIRTTGIIGTSRPDHSPILTPGMNEDILSGNNMTTTFRSDVRVMEKLETTVEAFTSDERNTESSVIIENAPKSVFVKEIEQFDSIGRMKFANSVPFESPDLILFRDPPVEIHNVTDGRSGGVATSIADKDRIWRASPSDIGTAATHVDLKNINEKLAFRKYLNELDLETIKMLERDHRARENICIVSKSNSLRYLQNANFSFIFLTSS